MDVLNIIIQYVNKIGHNRKKEIEKERNMEKNKKGLWGIPRFMPFDYMPYEEEREEYFLRMQDAFEVSGGKIAEWEYEVLKLHLPQQNL